MIETVLFVVYALYKASIPFVLALIAAGVMVEVNDRRKTFRDDPWPWAEQAVEIGNHGRT